MLFRTEIVGRVGRDAEVKTVGERQVAEFSVATSPYKSGKLKDKTVWVKVTAWNALADIVGKYVRKGMIVRVEGILNSDDNGYPRTFEANDGTTKASQFELTANDVLFLTRNQPVENGNGVEEFSFTETLDLTEEIPF